MKSYFTVWELTVMLFFAATSALINTFLPIKSITQTLGIPGPAAGMALLGGIIFVFWIALAHSVIQKKYSAIVTALFTAAFCLLIHPWYGVIVPGWFGIYAVIALLSIGTSIELINKKFINAGIGNSICLIITWLAIGFHTGIWIEPIFAPVMLLVGFVSGCFGAFLANIIR
ncbi:hypothetical protein BEH94_07595 [Candidatus Altiarchaeales archaeon WOR_SM1_SCG]|nr:hypothetical protein BEH94_07595 [Candidatus Altiarchaeales archaeon WOR_SM1_SCG]ODS37559.1 MAG: hypothetical protein A7315_13345 [Candidatus Altiarchaeales archaeon WOR_SM1_79]